MASYLNAVTAAAPDDVWAFGFGLNQAKAVFLHRGAHSWQVVPHPTLHGQQPVVYSATAISPDDVWAVGGVTQPLGGSKFIPFSLHWDGSGWHGVPVPFPPHRNSRVNSGSLFKVVANASNDVWAMGNYNTPPTNGVVLLHWNGSSWSQVTLPAGPAGQTYLEGTVAANGTGSVKVFGSIREPDGGYVPLIEQYAGGTWTTLPSLAKPGPHSDIGLGIAAQVAAGDIWAIGPARNVTVNGIQLPADGFAENWLGTSGTAHNLLDTVFAGLSDPIVNGVAGSAADNVWAFLDNYGASNNIGLATQWTGRHWSPLVSVPQQGEATFSTVYDMAVLGPKDAWAVGQVTPTGKTPQGLIAHWDGTAWSLSRLP